MATPHDDTLYFPPGILREVLEALGVPEHEIRRRCMEDVVFFDVGIEGPASELFGVDQDEG